MARKRQRAEIAIPEIGTAMDNPDCVNPLEPLRHTEWKHYGNNYEKPYLAKGDCSSSSSSSSSELALVNSESFRVYCKGVESEEMIKDEKVIVCGVGVAICDSRDAVIFKVSKAMKSDVPVTGKGKAKIGDEGMEMEAMIEGLNAALDLDLKKVTFFCEDLMVYNYVTGRRQPFVERISTLVNQFSLLQKKFVECKPLLVARNEMKFAFKLARDAINSQIIWSAEAVGGKKILKETCAICCEDRDVELTFEVSNCLHRYCFSCMKQHVESKLLNGMEAKCPHEGCKSEISIDSCGKFLDKKLVEIMSQRKKEASIAVTEKVYCPRLKCSALMSKSEVLEYTKGSFGGADQSGARICMKCNLVFCVTCKIPWHCNWTCNEYKRHNFHLRPEDEMLHSLAKKKRWRQCSKCSHMVELASGCNHITCRCGYEFCYKCGAPWENKEKHVFCEGKIIHRRKW